jgi:hypothetical protein
MWQRSAWILLLIVSSSKSLRERMENNSELKSVGDAFWLADANSKSNRSLRTSSPAMRAVAHSFDSVMAFHLNIQA